MDNEIMTTAGSTDNSSNGELSLDEQIDKALDEPETTVEEPAKENEKAVENTKKQPKGDKDNTIECPDKFKNEDGSINVQNLLKSYIGLEPIVNQKANLEKENAELLKAKEQLDAMQKQQEETARQAGFNSALDMQQSHQLAQFEANEYLKYLHILDEDVREDMKKLLSQYAINPTEESMKLIEVEFAPEINKRIAIQKDRMERQFEAEKNKNAETAKMSNIENVIQKSVEANNKLFDYPPFKELFTNTLYKYGDNFTYEDAKVLMDTIVALKGLFEEEFKKTSASIDANNKATDKLASISGQSSAPESGQVDRVDLNKITSAQLDKLLDKYI